MTEVDEERERILKEYIEGDRVYRHHGGKLFARR